LTWVAHDYDRRIRNHNAIAVPRRIPERNISLFTAHALVSERTGSSLKRGREDVVQPLLQVASRLLT